MGLIRLTDASSIASDDPLYVDAAQIVALQVNRGSINRGTLVTIANYGEVFTVREDIDRVLKIIQEATNVPNTGT